MPGDDCVRELMEADCAVVVAHSFPDADDIGSSRFARHELSDTAVGKRILLQNTVDLGLRSMTSERRMR
jgi:hypothetical protein